MRIQQSATFSLTIVFLEAVKDEIRNLEIRRGGEFLSHWIRVPSSVDKAIDGATETTESECFLSTAAVGESWVSLELPWSIVSHVNILTHQSGEIITILDYYPFPHTFLDDTF